jgi:hypothetical protein
VPHHRRTLTFETFDAPAGGLLVVGRLRDERPWAEDPRQLPVVHDLELRVTVSLPDLVVTDVEALFHTYPHAECPLVADAHEALVGVPVGRGWTNALRERLGGPAGCTHLRELARATAPVVLQSAFSARTRSGGSRDPREATAVLAFLSGTCHVWAPGGVAERKLDRGWVPGTTEYPVPAVDDLPRA